MSKLHCFIAANVTTTVVGWVGMALDPLLGKWSPAAWGLPWFIFFGVAVWGVSFALWVSITNG